MDGREVADQAADGIDQDEKRGNGSGLSNLRPFTKQKKRRQKNPAPGPGEAGKKPEPGPDSDRHGLRRRIRLLGIAFAKKQSRRREKQDRADQNSKNSSGRLQITAEVGSWKGKYRKGPK